MTSPDSPRSTPQAAPVTDWTIADVLDFESLLAADVSVPDDRLRQRDHQIFTEKIAPRQGDTSKLSRRVVFREWLEARRRERGVSLPGEAYRTARESLLAIFALVGLLMGVSLTIGLLHYSGIEPINAMLFLALTLGPQWLFLLGALLLWVERHTTRFLGRWRPLRAMMSALLSLFSATLRKLPGEQREALRATLSGFGPKRDIYLSLAGWPLLILTQVFAVCFNLGVLFTVLAELPARELRFGWQTTLNVSSEQAARVVKALAVPWSSFAPNPHPSAAQVIATRYAPGQAHWDLPGDAMRAWWPFLCYTVAFYGLAVRLGLLFFGMWKAKSALRSLKFDHADANALWRRLTGPQITARGGEAKLEDAKPVELAPPAPRVETKVEAEAEAEVGRCLALVAQDLTLPETQVSSLIQGRYGWQITGTRPAKVDNRGASGELFADIRGEAPGLLAIVVIIPATRDPIVAVALFLRELITASGGKPEVIVHLVGTPSGDGFAPVDDARFEIWRRFRDIQRLRIGLER